MKAIASPRVAEVELLRQVETGVIRPVTTADAAAIAGIYNYYVEQTIISFEETPVTAQEMGGRIEKITSAFPWLVCEEKGLVVGYAYASPWKTRHAYQFSVESTVYLDRDCMRRGMGAQLYRRLLEELRAKSIHVVIAGIALPNEGSVALHEKLGFKKIAHFDEVGRKFDRWIDVGYWELVL